MISRLTGEIVLKRPPDLIVDVNGVGYEMQAPTSTLTNGVPVYEYDARVVKKLIVGKGNAAKEQVQFMVARLLQIAVRYEDDEADAMAIALCHVFSHRANTRLAEGLAEAAR